MSRTKLGRQPIQTLSPPVSLSLFLCSSNLTNCCVSNPIPLACSQSCQRDSFKCESDYVTPTRVRHLIWLLINPKLLYVPLAESCVIWPQASFSLSLSHPHIPFLTAFYLCWALRFSSNTPDPTRALKDCTWNVLLTHSIYLHCLPQWDLLSAPLK